MILGKEHEPIDFSNSNPSIKEWLDNQDIKYNKKLLGLHKTVNGIAPGNFIGAVWLGEKENKTPLIVESKFSKMNYMSMYLACAEDPIISNHLKNCFDFWPEEPSIEAENLPKLSELLIAAFLRELNELCTRHLRKHFERETNNLRGRVKGKILLHRQVKQNLAHGREDRVFCSYQTINDDIPENRVLRAALEQSAKFFNSRPDHKPVLHRWIHSNRSALSGVSVVAVKKADFRHLRVRGSFSHYRRAIELAKFVLLRLGTNPHAEAKDNISTPPFAINSAELFERYAEKILRKKYSELEVGYNIKSNKKGFNVTVRPDFWVPKNSDKITKILDAKYKNRKEIENEELEKTIKPSREDIFQMIAYSRHQGLLEKLDCESNNQIELTLVYPDFEQEEKTMEIETEAFHATLQMLFVKCPSTEEIITNQKKAA